MEYVGSRRSRGLVAPSSYASPMEQQLNFDEDLTANGLKGHNIKKGKAGWTYSYHDPNQVATTPAAPTEVIYRTEGGKAPEYVLKKPTPTTVGGAATTAAAAATGAVTGAATGAVTGAAAATNRIILTQHAATANPLVQAISTITRGEVVHNAELLKTLETAKIALEEERARDPYLNTKGKKIASDAINLIGAMELAIREKNNDELLQRLIMHSSLATRDLVKVGSTAVSGTGTQMKGSIQESFSILRGLLMEIGKSHEFRELLIDTLDWMRVAFWSGAKRAGPSLGHAIKQDLRKGDMRMSETISSLSTALKQPATSADVGLAKTYESHFTVSAPPLPGDVSEQPVEVINRIRLVTTDPNPQIEIIDGGQVVDLSQKSADHMRRQTAMRLRELIRRFNSNPMFKKSGKRLMKLMRNMSTSAYTLRAAPETGSATQNITALGQEMKELLVRISGGQSMDPLIQNLTTINTAVRTDPQTLDLLREWREFLLLMFRHPEQLDGDAAMNTMYSLIDRSRQVATSPTYMDPLKTSVKEIGTILKGLTSDAVTRNLLLSAQTLLADLIMDETTNRPSFSAVTNSFSQIKHLIMPVVLKELEFVALPKVEGITPTYNFSVDNIVFSANDIIPEHVFLTLETDVDLATRQLVMDYSKAELKLKILNVRTLFENVRFFYQRKRFPKIHDEGLLDIGLLGAGISLSIDWVVEHYKGVPLQFTVRRATCAIDNLSINFKEAHHSFLDRTAVKMFNMRIKKQIEVQVANKLLDVGAALSNSLNKFFSGRYFASIAQPLGLAPTVAPVAPYAAAPLMGVPVVPATGSWPMMTQTGGYPVGSVRPSHHYGRGKRVSHYEGYQPWVNVATTPSVVPGGVGYANPVAATTSRFY